MKVRRSDPHSLVAAYALDALEAGEAASFEGHLKVCEACRGDLPGYVETAGRMGVAVSEEPPRHLKAEVLELARGTRQLSPLATHGRGTRRVAALAAALLLVTGTAVGVGIAVATGGQGRQPSAPTSEIAAVIAAPDAKLMKIGVKGGAMAKVVMSAQEERLVFIATGLRPLASSQRYQLWLVSSNGDRSAGVLPGPQGGMTGPVLVSGIRPGDRLALSIEPSPGSRQPTSGMLFLAAL